MSYQCKKCGNKSKEQEKCCDGVLMEKQCDKCENVESGCTCGK